MNAAQALHNAAEENHKGGNYHAKTVRFRKVWIGIWITDSDGFCRYYPWRAHG